jgi:valyl-tRNA synthetase
MPFITEEVWQLLGQAAPERGLEQPQRASVSIMIAPWPQADRKRQDAEIEARFAKFAAVLGALREIRSRQNIPSKNALEFHVRCHAEAVRLLRPMEPYFASMANARCLAWGAEVEPPATHAAIKLTGMDVFVDLKDYLDVGAELERNQKLEQKLLNQIKAKESKLANAGFVQRAPAEVVQRERESLSQLQGQLATVQAALAKLRK